MVAGVCLLSQVDARPAFKGSSPRDKWERDGLVLEDKDVLVKVENGNSFFRNRATGVITIVPNIDPTPAPRPVCGNNSPRAGALFKGVRCTALTDIGDNERAAAQEVCCLGSNICGTQSLVPQPAKVIYRDSKFGGHNCLVWSTTLIGEFTTLGALSDVAGLKDTCCASSEAPEEPEPEAPKPEEPKPEEPEPEASEESESFEGVLDNLCGQLTLEGDDSVLYKDAKFGSHSCFAWSNFIIGRMNRFPADMVAARLKCCN